MIRLTADENFNNDNESEVATVMTQMEWEKWLLEGFVESARKELGIALRNVEHSDKPDLRCEMGSGDKTIRVGMDIIDYYAGPEDERGSVNRRLLQGWREIATTIAERIATLPDSPLQHVLVRVKLAGESLPPCKEREQFIREAMGFVLEKSDRLRKGEATFEQCPFMNRPTLGKYVARLSLAWCGDVSHNLWHCPDVEFAFGGLTESKLVQIIEKKKCKLESYKAAGVNKVGLLIVAPGMGFFGPAPPHWQAKDVAAGLVTAMQKSGFDWFYGRGGQVIALYPQA